jgi:hypothetical protein
MKPKTTVQAPPVQELKNPRSCLRWLACGGCGGAITLVVGFFVLFGIILEPRPKQIDTLPKELLEAIPLYDQEHIDDITFLSGDDKSYVIDAALFLPKALLAPIMTAADEQDVPSVRGIWQTITTPVRDYQDTYTIEWYSQGASPAFILEHYQTTLSKAGFTLGKAQKKRHEDVYQMAFSKDNIRGTLYIHNNLRTNPTDLVTLTISTPPLN